MVDNDTTIADRVAEMHRQSAGRLPADIATAFDAERTRVVARGIPAELATAGTAMPDGDLLDVHDKLTTLAETRAGRPAVIVFYRGAWCPYCNVMLRAYQDTLVAELDRRGVALIAISPQKPDESLSLAEKHDLGYAVLSDPGNQLAHQLGIVYTLGERARAAQAALGVDIATGNADGTRDIPLTSTIVLDAHGTIQWIDVDPDYTTRTEPATILAAVDSW